MNSLLRAAVLVLAASILGTACAEAQEKPAAKNPTIVIETSLGTIKAELWADKAPITVANILSYVDKKFYDDTIFHRVIPNFMIQGGGFTADMKEKATDKPIKNEASADKPNDRGTLAMARTGVVDSATSQFYINLVDNKPLNHSGESDAEFGYCAFGKVISGMNVVDKIAKVDTGSVGDFQDVPRTPVVIKSIRRGE